MDKGSVEYQLEAAISKIYASVRCLTRLLDFFFILLHSSLTVVTV